MPDVFDFQILICVFVLTSFIGDRRKFSFQTEQKDEWLAWRARRMKVLKLHRRLLKLIVQLIVITLNRSQITYAPLAPC